MNKAFPVLMLALGFVAGTSVAAAYANGAIDMLGDVLIGGSLAIQDGTEGAGKVFTSDEEGVGSWQDPVGVAVEDIAALQTKSTENMMDIQANTDSISQVELTANNAESAAAAAQAAIEAAEDTAIDIIQQVNLHVTTITKSVDGKIQSHDPEVVANYHRILIAERGLEDAQSVINQNTLDNIQTRQLADESQTAAIRAQTTADNALDQAVENQALLDKAIVDQLNNLIAIIEAQTTANTAKDTADRNAENIKVLETKIDEIQNGALNYFQERSNTDVQPGLDALPVTCPEPNQIAIGGGYLAPNPFLSLRGMHTDPADSRTYLFFFDNALLIPEPVELFVNCFNLVAP